MNFNHNNIFGVILGWCTALWGWLTGSVEWTTQTIGEWPINQWAVLVGIVGVLANLYFAWARHRREVLMFEFDVSERTDRRTRQTRDGRSS